MKEELHEIIEFSPNIPLKLFMHKVGFVAKHWHNELELLMVLDGNIEIITDGNTSTLHTEDLILVNMNSIHEIHSQGAVMIALQIDLGKYTQFDQQLESVIFECNSSTSRDDRKFQGLRYAIASMIRENAHNSKGVELKNLSLSYYLLSELLSHFQIEASQAMQNQQKYMIRLTRILNYINDHYGDNFSLSDLAEIEQLSVPYLSNFFEKHMGINFSHYYRNIKLDHAIYDLTHTQDTIEVISLRNGFTEAHSFVRSFKQKYGTVPSIYRKEHELSNQGINLSNNLNYLLIEPSNYLNLLTKYLTNDQSQIYQPTTDQIEEITYTNIDVNAPVHTLTHTFKTFTTVGRAKDLLNKDIQDMLRDLQSSVSFEYIKFHGILSDDMMVVSRNLKGELQFRYTLVDMALDFLLSIGLKPLIQYSFMPKELASDPNKNIFSSPVNTSAPKHMEEWTLLIEDFTTHLITRYGLKRVSSWLFCLWNEPMTPKKMFGFNNDLQFFEFYKATYFTVKKVAPSLVFGAPSLLYMENLSSADWLRRFVEYTKQKKCLPEFMNLHYYSDIIPNSPDFHISSGGESFLPKRTDDFSLWIGSIKKILHSLGLNHLPVYLTEWNFTLSHRNLINDTCFKSCYLMKNLLKNYDRLDSFGYWSLTDLLEENPLPPELFHGGLGMYTLNGIRKNAFYVFDFASRLGDMFIGGGDGYFITKKEGSYQIITYNYIHYGDLFASGELFDITSTNRYSAFDMSKQLAFHLELTGLVNGRYEIKEYFINRDFGSAYDIWITMGGVYLDVEDCKILNNQATPGYHKEYRLVEKEKLIYHPVLKPQEIRFMELVFLHE